MTHDLGILDGDAFFLVVAIHRVLVLAHVFRDHLGRDGDTAARAIERFHAEAPDAKNLRDALTHLDEYALGRGKHRAEFNASGTWWPSVGLDIERGTLDLRLGTLAVELRSAARAALNLATTLDHLEPQSD